MSKQVDDREKATYVVVSSIEQHLEHIAQTAANKLK